MAAELFEVPVFRIFGDTCLLMEFGSSISPEIHNKVRAMAIAVDLHKFNGIREVVPTYRAVAIHYDPLKTNFPVLRGFLVDLHFKLEEIEIPSPRKIELPVLYGGNAGPDLGFVAKQNNLTAEEVIRIHSGQEYLIYMLGFTPGFPFLGGLSPSLHTPRLENPRKKVPAGSVGIANEQTGVYPVESPGGWQLIGRTPTQLFDPLAEDPFLLSSGSILKFKPVSEHEYQQLLLDITGKENK